MVRAENVRGVGADGVATEARRGLTGGVHEEGDRSDVRQRQRGVVPDDLERGIAGVRGESGARGVGVSHGDDHARGMPRAALVGVQQNRLLREDRRDETRAARHDHSGIVEQLPGQRFGGDVMEVRGDDRMPTVAHVRLRCQRIVRASASSSVTVSRTPKAILHQRQIREVVIAWHALARHPLDVDVHRRSAQCSHLRG